MVKTLVVGRARLRQLIQAGFVRGRWRGRVAVAWTARIEGLRLIYCDRHSSITISPRTRISGNTVLGARGGAKLVIGSGVFINRNCTIGAACEISISDDVAIGPGVVIVDATKDQSSRLAGAPRRDHVAAITVGEGAWIGANAVILPGVTIGSGAVVGAGAVVTKSVPSRTVVGGVPARVISTV